MITSTMLFPHNFTVLPLRTVFTGALLQISGSQGTSILWTATALLRIYASTQHGSRAKKNPYRPVVRVPTIRFAFSVLAFALNKLYLTGRYAQS